MNTIIDAGKEYLRGAVNPNATVSYTDLVKANRVPNLENVYGENYSEIVIKNTNKTPIKMTTSSGEIIELEY